MRKLFLIVFILLPLTVFGSNNVLEQKYNYKKLSLNPTFDWIISGKLDVDKVSSKVIDIDWEYTTAEQIEQLHKKGKIVVAYVSVGSWEDYREDVNAFNKDIIGNTYEGWEDEKYLDLSNYENFSKVMENRFDIIKEKGFDGIEPDNMGIFEEDLEGENKTGFNLTKEDGIEFAQFISKLAHERGMFILQKNGETISEDVEEYFDGALLEGTFYYGFQNEFTNYIKNKKPVFATEYSDNTSKTDFLNNYCKKAKNIGFTAIYKNRDLDKYLLACNKKEEIKKGYTLTKKDFILIDKVERKIDILVKRNTRVTYEILIKKLEKIKTKNERLKAIIFELISRLLNYKK